MKTLFCNGSLKGRWLDIPEGRATWYAPKLTSPSFDNSSPEVDFDVYHIVRDSTVFFGVEVRVSLAVTGPSITWGRDIAEMLYQRDILTEGARRHDP